MNKIFAFLMVLVLSVSTLYAKPEYRTQWSEANQAYTTGDYIKASQLYSNMVEGDYYSSDIYYNLGNCYFKMDKLSLAILNYKRALLLSPDNVDAKHNLTIAETQTTNRIEKVPQLFLVKWIDDARNILSSNSWAMLSLIGVALTLALLLIFYFSRVSFIRKSTFSLSIISLLVVVISLCFSVSQKSIARDSKEAVVMLNSVAVKSSPMQDGTDLFVLNEGASVEVKGVLGDWSEVVIASGNSGWLENGAIEYVNPLNR